MMTRVELMEPVQIPVGIPAGIEKLKPISLGLKTEFSNVKPLSGSVDTTKTHFRSILDLEAGNTLVPNTIQLLASLFIKLASKFHLDKIHSSPDGANICCSAGKKTRKVLFGSAILEVVSSITVLSPSKLKAHIIWHHPYNISRPESDVNGRSNVYKKRAKFIQLFNTSWQHLLEKIRPFLNSKESPYTQAEHSDMPPNFPRRKSLHKFNDEDINRLPFIPVIVRHDEAPSSLRSSLKTTKSNSTKSVRFSEKHLVHQLSLTKEHREARMSAGASALLPCGQLKPLRSPKTGHYIWQDASYELPPPVDLTNISDRNTTTQEELNQPKKRMIKRRDSPKRIKIC